jgi:thiol:disulfide interchange protein
MKKIILTAFLLMSACWLPAQDMSSFRLYKPEENAEAALADAIRKAGQQGKHVFIQVGGNWCVWCARFYAFVTSDPKIDSLLNAGFLVYHLNYSKENYNARLLSRYGYPQRFGFPVFLILNGKGELIHTQNSEYLEAGNSYDRRKVVEFLLHWSPAALDPQNYKEQ